MLAMFLITGASGSGKTTVTKSIERINGWKECISHTTRDMREGEVEGVAYYFISHEEFKKMSDNGEFAETAEYHDNMYGLSKKEVKKIEKENKNIFAIVEHEGYKQLKNIYPDSIGIFIYMSKEDCLANMLLRGDNLDNALSRVKTYDDEIKNRYEYDYVVKNVRNKESEIFQIIMNIIRQYKQES